MPTGWHSKLWQRFARRRERKCAVARGRASRRPFVRLVAHFLARLVRGGNDAASSEFELGAGGLLGLLAAPGAFSCLLMLDKYSTFLNWYRGRIRDDLYVTSSPDKHLFIALAMAVTGIVTVLKWDKILPDSQDYLNLAPLPVRPRSIFLANAAAIAIAVIVLAVDVSGVSTVLFPMIVTAGAQQTTAAFVAFISVHAACMLLASCFTFCAVFALLGTLGALLPQNAFRSISSWVRGGALVGFIVLLMTGCAGPNVEAQMVGMGRLRLFPSFWYLGLYQALQHRPAPALAESAHLALPGVVAAFLLMLVSYALSYHRRFVSVLERGRRASGERLVALFLRPLDLFSARTAGFARACHHFAVRALLRNEAHRLCLSVALGLGWLLAIQSISEGTESGFLKAPLIAAYVLLLGVRLAFELPAGVAANWVFRAVLDPRENESHSLARRVMLGFLTPFVLLPSLVFAWWRSGLMTSAIETAFVLALSLCLMDVLLSGYRKIPLACSAPGFRENLLVLCLLQFMGFELFTHGGALLEAAILKQPALFLVVPTAMLAGSYWRRVRWKNALEAGEAEVGLTFESFRRPAVERLNLSD